MLLSCVLRGGVRHGSTATTPPSATFPAGLSGGRIRSLIHASLVVVLTRQVTGSHICELLVLGRTLARFWWLAKSRQIL